MIHFQFRVLDVYRNIYSIEIMDGDRHIGHVSNRGVSNRLVKGDALCSWIMLEYRNMGIISKAIVEYMKVFGLGKTYQCVIHDSNKASQRVKDKLGFTFFSQDFSSWEHNGKRWTEPGTRTYIITYKGESYVELSEAA